MSRSKHAVELCALLVDEIYGELSSRIFTILLRRGRLQIKQLSRHTGLNDRQVQHGLVVLVQQGLVYFNSEKVSNVVTTYYEANHDAAYGLVRSGKIMEAVESRYGLDAKDVVQNLFLLGHTKVSDLEKVYERKAKSKSKNCANSNGESNGDNEQDKTPKISVGQLHAILIRLLEARIIQPVVSSMFLSPTDTYEKAERELLKTYGGSTKGVKQKDEMNSKIRERLQAIRSEGQNWQLKCKKRPLNGAQSNGVNGAAKRRRLSNGGAFVNSSSQYEDDGSRLDPDLILRINYEKCIVALRNQQVVALANDRIGETTSLIYAQGLRLIEEKIERCRLDPKVDDMDDLVEGPTFTTMEVAAALSKSVNAARGIGKESGPSDHPPVSSQKAKKRRADGIDEDEVMATTNGNANGADGDHEFDILRDDPFADEDIRPAKRTRVTFQDQLLSPSSYEDSENRILQVKKHLQILAQDECKFLRHLGGRGQGEWAVDFDAIIHYMQEAELDVMMLEKYGKSGHRLARMMRKLGKLDEKQLPNLALMKQKDIRTKLAEMQMAGVVDIQEVPRDAGRTTARTIFLWYFDTERVSAILLDSIYKSMSRCYQRLDVEKRRSQDILTLTERSDVRDQPPEEYLDESQVVILEEIRAKERNLLGQIHRLDEMVGVFRDY